MKTQDSAIEQARYWALQTGMRHDIWQAADLSYSVRDSRDTTSPAFPRYIGTVNAIGEVDIK